MASLTSLMASLMASLIRSMRGERMAKRIWLPPAPPAPQDDNLQTLLITSVMRRPCGEEEGEQRGQGGLARRTNSNSSENASMYVPLSLANRSIWRMWLSDSQWHCMRAARQGARGRKSNAASPSMSVRGWSAKQWAGCRAGQGTTIALWVGRRDTLKPFSSRHCF